MSNKLTDIEQIIQQTPQLPTNPTAKQTAIDLALARFDENNLKLSQGNTQSNRLKDTALAVGHYFFGRTRMKTYQTLAAGAFCAFLVIWAALPVYRAGQVETVLDSLTRQIGTQPTVVPAISESASLSPDAQIAGSAAPPETPQLTDAKAKQFQLDLAKQDIDRQQLAANQAQSESGIMAKSMLRMETAAKQPAALPSIAEQPAYYQEQGRDRFKSISPNTLIVTKAEPVSTFSIDVDTASYSFMRASLQQNVLPPKDAIRTEELINYFPYQYPAALHREEPFRASIQVLPTPWNKATKLVHIGIKGYELANTEKPAANLVFLIDTSGSMNEPNKLPLLQNALKLLLDSLSANDNIAIVTYAGNAGVALPPTKASEKSKIMAVIDNLLAGGGTAGGEGIRQAYQLAEQHFNPQAVNRVILATDGDFNVGINDTNQLKSFIERKRETGISLSVLGFGMGNYNDELMQVLAQNGNGNAAYIDTLNEARKTLVEQAGATLFTIAKDVKIQVEFNAAQIAEYRLLGYETRLLNKADFNNDKVDAGDIGSGHTVTALYEITPVDSQAKLVDALRYSTHMEKQAAPTANLNEYGFVKIRYKLPNSNESKLLSTPINQTNEFKTIATAPEDSRFAVAVAAFAQLLRGEAYLHEYGYDDVINLASTAKGEDKFGYRSEFINLVRLAKNAPALPKLTP